MDDLAYRPVVQVRVLLGSLSNLAIAKIRACARQFYFAFKSMILYFKWVMAESGKILIFTITHKILTGICTEGNISFMLSKSLNHKQDWVTLPKTLHMTSVDK